MSEERADLQLVVDYHQAQAVESGHPPRNVAAWRAACERDMRANEQAYPGYIERAAAGLRARAAGRHLTYCREVRGTHAFSHIYDPNGTDPPPSWWNRDEAKRQWEAERRPKTTGPLSALGNALKGIDDA